MAKKKFNYGLFDHPNCPKWAMSLTIDSDGSLWAYDNRSSNLTPIGGIAGCWCEKANHEGVIKRAQRVDDGYDATRWQYAALNRKPNHVYHAA